MLRWLRMHCHPPNVSGTSHRFQLYLALSYMDMCTCTTEGEHPLAAPSLLSLGFPIAACCPARREGQAQGDRRD